MSWALSESVRRNATTSVPACLETEHGFLKCQIKEQDRDKGSSSCGDFHRKNKASKALHCY